MHNSLARFLVILIILTISRSMPAAAQQASLLQYEDTLEITTTGATEIANQSFTITAGDTEITNLQFTPGELADSAGTLSVAAEAITITPNLVEQLEASTPLTVTVSISTLPKLGTYTGGIAITYDQQPEGASEVINLSLTIAEATEVADESAAEQPDELHLVITTKPGGSVEDIFFRILGDESTTSIPLYIRQTGDTEISSVRFFAYLTDAQGQQLSGVSFNLIVGGTDVTGTGITIPAGEKQVLATLNVANLTATGAFSGDLVAEYDGKLVEAAVLKGERFPLPALRIVGTTTDGVVNLASRITNFSVRLRLESTNLTTVDDLKIFVDNFSDPNGNQIPVSWTANSQPGENTQLVVPGLGSVDLEVTAELPIASEYTGAITLVYAGKRETVNLKVNRTRPELTVSILGLETATGQVDPLRQDNVSLRIMLHETAGQKVTLSLPQLTVLSLVGVEKATYQAQFERLEIRGEDGITVTEPFTIGAGEVKPLLLNIHGLSEAGIYEGKLMLTAPDAASKEHDVTILVKEPWWIAGLLIGLGVSASFAITVWQKITRPRLERQLFAGRLLNDLERENEHIIKRLTGKQGEEEVAGVVDRLRYRLEDLYDLRSYPKAEEALQEINKKIRLLPLLVNAYERSPLHPELATITAEMPNDTLSAEAAESRLTTLLENIPPGAKVLRQKDLVKFGPRDRKMLESKRFLGDVIVFFLALLVAVVFGLYLLWAGDATWGGSADYLVAGLWGFGLHQVGSQTGNMIVDKILTSRSLATES